MTVDVVTGEVVPMTSGALSPEAVASRAQWVRDIKRAALTEGVDYGHIPGTGDRPALLKPGAEQLIYAAGFSFTIDERPTNRDGALYRVSVRRADDSVVAECDGFAGYDESRFYTSAETNEQRERYWAEKDRRRPNPAKMAEYRAPWNTLVKMAQKRALVGAALNACAASGLFVADVDDGYDAAPTVTDPPPTTTPTTDPRISDLVALDNLTRPPDDGSAPVTETPADLLIPGRTKLVADLNKAAVPVRRDFMAWVRSRGYTWPPEAADVVVRCTSELEALIQRARQESDAYGRA